MLSDRLEFESTLQMLLIEDSERFGITTISLIKQLTFAHFPSHYKKLIHNGFFGFTAAKTIRKSVISIFNSSGFAPSSYGPITWRFLQTPRAVFVCWIMASSMKLHLTNL